MKKPIVIAGIAISTVGVIGILLAGLQSQADTTPTEEERRSATITSTTETTKEEPQGETKKEEKENQKEIPKKALYVEYDEDTFSAHLERTRILFFYDKSHAPSQALDILISDSLEQFPDDLSIFKTTLQDAKEEADTLGVTDPGVAISFTSDTQLQGVYVAPEKPNLDSFLAVLGIES